MHVGLPGMIRFWGKSGIPLVLATIYKRDSERVWDGSSDSHRGRLGNNEADYSDDCGFASGMGGLR